MTPSAGIPDRVDAHHLLVKASSGRTTATYPEGQAIYRQGEPAEVVYFIQQGDVELSLSSEEDVRTVMGTAKEGQFFGVTCLYDVPVRIATATAITQSRTTAVTKCAMLAAIRERPRFAKMFIEHLWHNGSPQKDVLDRLLKRATGS